MRGAVVSPRMNFDLADLRAFVAVAKLGSFRAAAAELHLSQPALSRRIEKLEAALGVRLFHRTTRKVDLTAVGREFSQRANELLNSLEESLLGIRDVASRVSGDVTVACIPSAVRFFLPNILKAYHERYPGIVVRLIDQGANDVLSTVVAAKPISESTTWAPRIRSSTSIRSCASRSCSRATPATHSRRRSR